ncbi:hypothetical protein CBF34_10895 [Vagococcus penaei]|uniref:Uncharacterized protein n=1 Tax=Vagococcus penaei TaxID=633807 RepID=A0A1Q2D3B5_9ENTE|nr:hypothetical protein [Vagococcus penaei]AQP52872.1 hypothetical protein BW732_00630 [Vagococcus penaei]RST97636.1 hypothetical protein CBF34_10895 [Vagococcus penaei]
MTIKQYTQKGAVLGLSVLLILFTQWIKLIKNPESTPITTDTLVGLIILWSFAMLGILVSMIFKKYNLPILADFPILGWVSIVSLVFCLASDFFVVRIGAVDFLSITTPILAFAGISVANSLADLSKASWKIGIVAIFVFIGTYLGSSIIAQIGLMLSGKL